MVRCDPPASGPCCSATGRTLHALASWTTGMFIRNRIARPAGGCRLLVIFPTAMTRNSGTATAFSTASVCPGLAAGTRFRTRQWSWLRS